MKKLFFTLLVLCIYGTTWAASHEPDITIEGENGGNTYYFDIVSDEEGNRTVELTYYDSWSYGSSGATSYSGDITDIPEKITFGEQEYSVIGIGDYAFANCAGVTSMVIPSFIQYINTYGIYGMDTCATIIFESSENTLQITDDSYGGAPVIDTYTEVKELTLNRDIKITSNQGLSIAGLCVGNPSLQKVSIGGAATEVYDYSFDGCTALTDVTLSDSITAINERAFEGCTALKEITIPASVQSFGEYCFGDCSSLSRIFLLATDPSKETLSVNDFANDDNNVTIYVPRGSAAAYVASQWQSVATADNLSFNFSSLTTISEDTADEDGNYYATYYYDGATGYEIDDYENSEIYAITNASGGAVTTQSLRTESAELIPTGIPLFIKSSTSGGYYLWRDYYGEDGAQTGYYSDITPTTIENPSGNMLYGHSTSGTTFAIEDGTQVTTDYYFYKLSLDSSSTAGSIGFYWGASGGVAYTASANRCWLAVSEAEATNLSYISFKKDEGDTTGISSVESATEKAVSGIYTIQGVRVSNMNQPGLYIVDGKKVLVK